MKKIEGTAESGELGCDEELDELDEELTIESIRRLLDGKEPIEVELEDL